MFDSDEGIAATAVPNANVGAKKERLPLAISATQSVSREPDVDTPRVETEVNRTARSVLSEYWGTRWTEIERALIDAGIDLNAPFELVPWETAEAELSKLVPLDQANRDAVVGALTRWHSTSAPVSEKAWIEDRYDATGQIDQDAVVEICRICTPYNDQLNTLGLIYADQINAQLMARWRSGDFIKAPLASYGVPRQWGFYSVSHAASGWSIVITLTAEECPEIMDTKKEAASLVHARDEAVHRYLTSRRR